MYRVRRLVGSHDKLAAEMQRRTGRKQSRQMIIGWEKDKFPSQANAEVLAELANELGVTASADDFQRESVERRAAETLSRLERAVLAAEQVADRLEALIDGLGDSPNDPLHPHHER